MSIEDIRKKHERAIVEEFGTPRLLFAQSGSNEEKREPLLSADVLYFVGLKASEKEYGAHAQCMAIVGAISSAYERLIDEGKLRVVEEVTLVYVQGEYGHCDRCNRYVHNVREADVPRFCPGCGNKIKR